MNDTIATLTLVSSTLRTLVLAGGLVFAGVALVDWAVRTRRISPFSGVARFMRMRVEPRIAGIERQVARAGGHHSSTPWWALVVYIVAALLLLAAFDLLISLLDEVMVASSLGAGGVLLLLVRWTFAFLRFALLVRIIASWLPGLSGRRWISWSFGATEWMLRPLRRVIPSIGVIDITPIVAYFALRVAQWLVETVLLAGLR
ncbi:MAG: YggT family protein [Gemmatimonadaceae bacterium]|nr:YggT family protein [Gemmatimonadaceae bacterium]NUP55333.1 YggT family protein [Gemmatimonadaceae bacterium]NUR34464.1 YggT family protein [Gemmatimonadaceae bacterium]NUS34626.1 YggT family protein [Gemmatimonadaceae bacterium]